MKRLKRGDVVAVAWQDAVALHSRGWLTAAELLREYDGEPTTTAGVYVGRRCGALVLAQSVAGGEDRLDGGFAIPRGSIVKVTRHD